MRNVLLMFLSVVTGLCVASVLHVVRLYLIYIVQLHAILGAG